jgi:(1->4)-alpha-D-glucan 1-alpha-D-glucosylmutase
MQKAMREAKVYTSWINPSEPHEQAMAKFVETTLAHDNTAFRSDFLEFQRRLALFGIFNSLAQTAIKIGAPGVPDFYQGTELWNFSLVDPDNRRPVDYEHRQKLLAQIDCDVARSGRAALATELVTKRSDDRLKLYATATMLRYRREHADLFADGGYVGLEAEGARRHHVFAFARTPGTNDGDQAGTTLSGGILVIVPRLVAGLVPDADIPPIGDRVWSDTHVVLPAGGPSTYRNVFTDRPVDVVCEGTRALVRVAQIFESFPIAMLEPGR